MEDQCLINMQCDHQKYCVSYYTIKVCNVGATLAVKSWNSHKIPGMMYYYGDYRSDYFYKICN